jgi:hypothetical protein
VYRVERIAEECQTLRRLDDWRRAEARGQPGVWKLARW